MPTAVQLILRLPVGVLADKIGRHKIFLLAGMLTASAACAIRVAFPGMNGFLISSLLSGVSSSTWLSFMVMHAGCYGADEQQMASGRIIFANNGGILGAFITGTLLYERIGMRAICVLGVIAGLTGAALCLRLTEERKLASRIRISQFLKVCTNRCLIFFSVLALIQQGIQMATTMSFTAQILKDIGASEGLLGISSILYMISAVVSSYASSCSFVEKRRSRFWISTIFGGLAIYCILVPICGSIPVILGLQIIPGLASGFLFSILTAKAMTEVPEEKKSTAMGMYQAVYAIGMTVFPILTGNISGTAGLPAAYFALGGISALSVLVALVSPRLSAAV